MMQNLIVGKKTISFNGCMAQLFTFTSSAATELVLVNAMAFDRSILKIQGSEGKSRAFSTCYSPLVVVGLYYSTITYTYIQPPSGYSLDKDKMVSELYTLVIPVLNPLIYSLRDKEVKMAFTKILTFCKRDSY
ncbi:hypothetical protein Y1Q_0016611 [Alligator mississippiensis]|uniref:G-protein coupled receptors family 1 profile domain-containing protein n=1 Tax=Alligator mississippiensis TaxID=8496 RepID=A0A151N3K2_ALLMI|nr:hypothetical protein Y1Q_0016611 [Alligator mississippiensis]